MNWVHGSLALAVLGACRSSGPENATTGKSTSAPSRPVPPAVTASALQPPRAEVPISRASANRWDFDSDELDRPPAGFSFARTGGGKLGHWVVQRAEDAPTPPNVLAQLDADPTDARFPIALADESNFRDLRLAVSCKPISGKIDEACGLIWRVTDANNYYLVRANALEDNVRLYFVKAGSRVQFASWSGRVRANAWHRLVVEARADRFVVTFDGAKVLDARDATFSSAGKVGTWTKADSITLFDSLEASAL